MLLVILPTGRLVKTHIRSMDRHTDVSFSASLRAGNEFENDSGSFDVQETSKRTNCVCSRSQSFTPTMGEDSRPVIEYFRTRNGAPRTPEATTVRHAGWSNALGLTSSMEIELICVCAAKHRSRAYCRKSSDEANGRAFATSTIVLQTVE